MKQYNNITINNNGISIILSVVVLTAMVGLIIAVANISLRITKSNQGIGTSETAFFAAESAAEMTIYDIEKNNRGLDLLDLIDQPLTGITGATWGRQVTLSTHTPGLCSAPQAKPVCTNNSGTVNNSNDLLVSLTNGESFQFELNILNSVYPNHIRINWPGANTKVIVSGAGQQQIFTTTNVKIPSTGNIDPADGYRFRIINESGGTENYTISINGTTDLPLGLNILTTGKYQNSERRLEIVRPAWLIY